MARSTDTRNRFANDYRCSPGGSTRIFFRIARPQHSDRPNLSVVLHPCSKLLLPELLRLPGSELLQQIQQLPLRKPNPSQLWLLRSPSDRSLSTWEPPQRGSKTFRLPLRAALPPWSAPLGIPNEAISAIKKLSHAKPPKFGVAFLLRVSLETNL